MLYDLESECFVVPNPISNLPVHEFKVDKVTPARGKFVPPDPLPKTSFMMYIVGMPKSGKTHLWTQMMLSGEKENEPRYYRKWFWKTHLFSGSLDTLVDDVPEISKMPPEQLHTDVEDERILGVVDELRDDKNKQYLFIIDDLIMDISKSKAFAKITMNRRHCTQDCDQKGTGGLSMILISQKYNELKLTYRTVASDVILFKTNNTAERNTIRRELMGDLNPDQQDLLFDEAWSEPHSFLYIKATEPTRNRYYIKFDKFVFPERQHKKRKTHRARAK